MGLPSNVSIQGECAHTHTHTKKKKKKKRKEKKSILRFQVVRTPNNRYDDITNINSEYLFSHPQNVCALLPLLKGSEIQDWHSPHSNVFVLILYINIELVNEQPIGKCLTLSYCKKTKNVILSVPLATKMSLYLQKVLQKTLYMNEFFLVNFFDDCVVIAKLSQRNHN